MKGLVAVGRSVPAATVPLLLRDALTALDAGLGERCAGWAEARQPGGRTHKQRVYQRRLEMLAEALDPATLPGVAGGSHQSGEPRWPSGAASATTC